MSQVLLSVIAAYVIVTPVGISRLIVCTDLRHKSVYICLCVIVVAADKPNAIFTSANHGFVMAVGFSLKLTTNGKIAAALLFSRVTCVIICVATPDN